MKFISDYCYGGAIVNRNKNKLTLPKVKLIKAFYVKEFSFKSNTAIVLYTDSYPSKEDGSLLTVNNGL
jgi:hypothetical protein